MTETVQPASEKLLTAKRIPGIDLAEAFAALMVVIYHISLCSYKLFEDPTVSTAITYFCRTILVTCVPIFLMVNGFLLLRHELNLKKHVVKTVRLFLLSLFWGVAPLQTQLMLDGSSLTPLEFIKTMMQYSGPTIHLWYMGALVCIYLFFPLIKLVYDKDRRIFLFFLIFSFAVTFGNRVLNQINTIVLFLQGGYQGAEVRNNWFSIFNPYNAVHGYTFVYFCLGGLLPDMVDWLQKHFPAERRRRLVLCAAVFAGAVVHALWFLFLNYTTGGYYLCVVWYGYNTLSALVMTLCVVLLCLEYQGLHSVPCRLVRTVSEHTLGIYFLHMIILLPLKVYMWAHLRWLCNLPGNILVGAAVTAVCVLISMGIRKIPGIRYLLQ